MDNPALRLYAQMGAVPVINALGHMTMLGGSCLSPQVLAAMQEANRYYVDMDELLDSTGRIIAGMLGCPAALVTSGCAAALLLGTAACMAGSDRQRMGQLPNADGLKDEVLMQRPQRFKYDRVVRMAGARIAEAGDESATTAEQLAAAIGPRTVALLYPAHDERPGLVPLREAIAVARRYRIPVIVDAASRVYPVDGLSRYAAWGADLVGYGAKYFGAPNSTGLLCGRQDLVEAARMHSFASFEKNSLPGYGRPMKVDRQEVIGVVVALRQWLEMDHAARFAGGARRGAALCQALSGLHGLQAAAAGTGEQAATVVLRVDQQVAGRSAADLSAALRSGYPSIWTYQEGAALALSMLTVVDGDELVIAQRVREICG
jgi:L-seryl-tRNA(Ser) seleniumtransferase